MVTLPTPEPTEDSNLATMTIANALGSALNADGLLDFMLEGSDDCGCDICRYMRAARRHLSEAASEISKALAMHRECDAEMLDDE